MSISSIAPAVSVVSFLAMTFIVWRKAPSAFEEYGTNFESVKQTKGFAARLAERMRSLPWERYEQRILVWLERVLVFLRRWFLKFEVIIARWITKIRKYRNHSLNGNHTAPIWEEIKNENETEAKFIETPRNL